MLKSKILLSVIIFSFLFSLTSFLKNETRIIEKKINSINSNINNLQKKIYETKIEYYYLSSPANLDKEIKLFGSDYIPISKSNIYSNLDEFMNEQKKISKIEEKYIEKEKK
tara:strand:+ start:96 stop:428 length:333 start_codon:yes stop_codon:yes gene_type:complete